MTSRPVVSVVLPVHNGVGYLPAARRQLESLSGPELEIVVVDDASDDGTAEHLVAWEREDTRVRVLRMASPSGVAAARNHALTAVRGDWLWFVDCDDEWDPTIVERLVAVARGHQADVVCCEVTTRHEDGSPGPVQPTRVGSYDLDGDEALRWLVRGELRGNLWNKLFTRALFDDVRFPSTWAHSDLGAMPHLLVRARRVTVIDDVLYTYVLRPNSIIGSGSGRSRDLLTVLEQVNAATQLMRDRGGVDDDLRVFAYREVFLNTLHRQFRRGTLDDTDREVRREIRNQVTVGATWGVARRGRVLVAAATASAAHASAVHSRLYRALRQRRWQTAPAPDSTALAPASRAA
jgi:glycosyltransferase involved in cell wall biosynthesis